jgi:hypothetical protein
MTRNSSDRITRMAREQYQTLRATRKEELAEQVLSIVSVRFSDDEKTMYVAKEDIQDKEIEVMKLLGQIRAWFTAVERKPLYKSNEHLATEIVKLILRSRGHPLEEFDDSTQWTLDQSLY